MVMLLFIIIAKNCSTSTMKCATLKGSRSASDTSSDLEDFKGGKCSPRSQTWKVATMIPIPAKVVSVAKQSSQYRVLVQIELEAYPGSFRTLRFGEQIPFTGSCHNRQLDLFYYRDPGLKPGKAFPLWTIQ
jgi:hypothetical protein